MKKVSGSTFFGKKLFPTIWFGFLGLMIIGMFNSDDIGSSWPIILPMLGMAAVGFVLFRHLAWHLADEVFDHGDSLEIIKGNKRQVISLTEIINIDYNKSQGQVTLNLREAGALGKDVTFVLPTMGFGIFSKSPYVTELIERVDEARRKSYIEAAKTL